MLRLLKVSGDSLLPAFREGDFVLVSRIPFLLRRARPGDTVILEHREYGTLIKRIGAVSPDGKELTVVGTHPWSVDSRRFGPVQVKDVIGKVLWHVKQPPARD